MNLTSGEISKRINVHGNTVRVWADQFKPYMSPGAVSSKRRFTEDDLRVLATIAHYREMGISMDEIKLLLADGKRIDEIPPQPDPEEENARSEIKLVPKDQLFRALDEVKRLEEDRLKLVNERDLAIERRDRDVTTYNERINVLEREIGQLRGTLAERLPTNHWLERLDNERRKWLVALAVAVIVAVIIMIVLFVVVTQAARVG